MTSPVSNIADLEAKAKAIRRLILQTTHHAGMGHTGGSLSEADILTALFFQVMRNRDIANRRVDRDRFILSKGHASPGYYSTLALRGYFPIAVLDTLDSLGSILQGHPDMHKTPGVDMSSGSLGQGLSCGIGIQLAAARDPAMAGVRTFVLIGDGEMPGGPGLGGGALCRRPEGARPRRHHRHERRAARLDHRRSGVARADRRQMAGVRLDGDRRRRPRHGAAGRRRWRRRARSPRTGR